MQTDNSLISHLEKLARLQLDEVEKSAFAKDLRNILDMIDHIKDLDTSGIEPLAYPVTPNSDFRPDEVGKQLPRQQALISAPRQDGQFFQVPKIID